MSENYISLLRKARLDRKLSLRQVADATGISRSVLQRIETGERVTKRKHARALFKFYRGTVDMSDIYDPMYRPVAKT